MTSFLDPHPSPSPHPRVRSRQESAAERQARRTLRSSSEQLRAILERTNGGAKDGKEYKRLAHKIVVGDEGAVR